MDEEPKCVKDLLVEAKDASELMVDLAYAAVFFEDEKLASEVGRLEERMDGYLRRLRQVAMLAGKIHSLSPLEVLARGYTITQDARSGAVVRSAEQLSIDQSIVTRFATGAAVSKVESIEVSTPNST